MTEATGNADDTGALVSWENGIGDDAKYHIAHITAEGITLVSNMKDYQKWFAAVAAAKKSPTDIRPILSELPKVMHFERGQISKATYAKDLSQLSLFDHQQRKTKVPEGKEQAAVFAAIKQYLGGTESEEEADAWSVMQGPLLTLSIIGVIGGFFIWFTTICEADFQAEGRKAGMKNLLNWVGYNIGPFWMSVAVGSLAALVLLLMISQLVKRPIRQVLEYSV